MANITAPKGFVPLRHMDGAPFNNQTLQCTILAADAVATFVGDVVQWDSTSAAAGVFVNGIDTEGMPAVKKIAGTVAAGTSLAGVVMGFLPNPTNLGQKHRSASTAAIVLVCVDPSVVYEVQEDATGNVLAAADMQLNASFNAGAGNATTGVSTGTINNASKAATSTLPLRILGLVKRPDNAFNTGGVGTDQAKFEVIFNATGIAFGGAGIAGTA